ncbi:GNAT family N-acetyltransferase [Aliidiomarina sedimenti]|uniref:GNAT family N-acetyltransferase n=1 Tax=Aliidiomarina sedimenti TaxID=1933879 RepID=A0ABY0BZI4_9GAMM|nr:GNAT family N-acetyltransferase [Aliidiomarina sedimenti]
MYLRNQPVTISITTATTTDIPAIAELEQHYYQQEGYPAGFLYQALRQWPAALWVAQSENQLMGYALIAPAQSAQGSAAEPWLMALLVAAAGRGKGIGRKLCEAAINHCRDQGQQGLWLSVAEYNQAAMQLYLSLGFEAIELRKDFLGPGEDRLLMRLALQR